MNLRPKSKIFEILKIKSKLQSIEPILNTLSPIFEICKVLSMSNGCSEKCSCCSEDTEKD